YGRAWLRLASSNDAGMNNPFAIHGAAPGIVQGQMIGLEMWFPDAGMPLAPGLYVVGNSGPTGTTFRRDRIGDVRDGAWHLVEIAALGIGTDAGVRRCWIDGASAYADGGLYWVGSWAGYVSAGMLWYEGRTFTGSVIMDDVRVSGAPP